MTPEEFVAMQRMVEVIRNNGVEYYAIFPGAHRELGSEGKSLAAEWQRARNAKLEAEQKMRELEDRWREVYGTNEAGVDSNWYETMSRAKHGGSGACGDRCVVKEPATPLKMVIEYEYEIEPAAV